MNRVILPFSLIIGVIIFTIAASGGNTHLDHSYESSPVVPDTLPPLKDRFEDFINSEKNNPFDLKDPKAVDQNVEYDPVTNRYIVREKIGDYDFRPPTYLTFEEYMEYRRKQDQDNYFKQLGGINTGSGVSALDPIAKIDVKNSLLDRLFGGTTVDIRPQGNIDLTFGAQFQKVENPILPIRQQRQGGFDFDMNIQMNVTGKIGEKLNLSTQYNTNATFNFDNQIKLNYNSDNFDDDAILKKIEAGNVSLPLRGTLIQGAQSLFGLKTELQFGHLRLTTILSQQQSQRENIQIQGGSQLQQFEVRADEYDENRHFFVSHYNRNTFEEALTNLPQIKTLFKIENIEVWLTNNRNEVDNVRDIIAFADLGESIDNALVSPDKISIGTPPRDVSQRPLPNNNANNLYKRLVDNPKTRSIDDAVGTLQNEFGLQQAKDFEKVSARKLQPSEYTFNAELGFVSLNINVQPDQVVAVSYQYSYNGQTYKVGELAQNQAVTGVTNRDQGVPDPTIRDTVSNLKVLFVKMLKSTTQRTDVPTWDLMMKNVYSIGAFNVNQQDFRLDAYYDDPGKGLKRFLPDVSIDEPNNVGVPLLRVLNLDTLNTQNDPQPDGVFDFIPGVTINLRNGRIMFPVLEPFGDGLAKRFADKARDSAKYVYQQLYDSTLFVAREYPEKNRFLIKGNYKSSVTSEISLGAFNIPIGSVRVTAGGQQLIEGSDYEIDYNIGRVKILNDALLSSGAPINVSFEDNTLFGFQTKTMIGLRADYEVDKDFNIGATVLQLFERPFTQKVNIGEDPINNKMYGLDLNLSRPAPWLTKAIDALPFIDTKAESKITVTAEGAAIQPGHARAINQNKADKGGVVYLDDFEGSASSFDLRQPINQWFLASVPQNDAGRNNPLFPEASLINDKRSGVNRARLNWYIIDNSVRSSADRSNPYTNLVDQRDVFPNLQLPLDQQGLGIQTMNMTFYPEERGPYNFEYPDGHPIPGSRTGKSAGLTLIDSLKLNDPETRWGGIMKALKTTDFQASNIEFLEFWMLSPFLDDANAADPSPEAKERQGTLYIDLGNVSEDILRDSRKFFENGLPAPNNMERQVNYTKWSRVPVGQQITRSFDVDAAARKMQDVGLDGLNDSLEIEEFGEFLDTIGKVNPVIAASVKKDPSNDNFRYYRDPSFGGDVSVRQRYRDFNNPDGNSQENSGTNLVSSGTNIPDAEDLNGDNTLNESESYFHYKISLVADLNDPRKVNLDSAKYITDTRVDSTNRIWYRFRVPLSTAGIAVNGIRDFRSIRFMRMYMHGFRKPTTLRFATLELVRNQWRRYGQDLSDTPGGGLDICGGASSTFDIDAVNIEENSGREPFNYVLPREIVREQSLGVFNAQQNEQSLSMIIKNLCDGNAKGVFKNLNFDMRVYDRMKMFIHAEAAKNSPLANIPKDGDLRVFIRLGSDIKENYYEYSFPLTLSKPENLTGSANSSAYKDEVWRPDNEFDISLRELVDIKNKRDTSDTPPTEVYSRAITYTVGKDTFDNVITRTDSIRVRGNPNLSNIKITMIGVRNPSNGNNGQAYDVEIWANELRLTGLDERGGTAAIARIDLQLADLGTMTLAGNYSSIGFGQIDQKVQERSRESIIGYDFATSLELGRFLPQTWGIRLPFFAQISNQTKTPEYDPYDSDVKVKDKYINGSALLKTGEKVDTVRKRDIQDITNIRSYNFTNVRKDRVGGGDSKPMPWDISNFSFSYAFTETERSDPLIEFDQRRRHTGGFDYAFSRNVKYIEPFKKLIKVNKVLDFFKEFNFNPLPNSFAFSTLLDRRFDRTRYRFTGYDTEQQIARFATFYNKRFTWDRDYNLQWDLSRSLKITFDALANATIDEPDEEKMLRRVETGEISDINQYRRDSILGNIKNLGRTKNYQHNLNISYQLPLRLLPYMDWVQARANYQAEYGWVAGSVNVVDALGNTIRNSQNRQLSVDLNFSTLYGKFKYLRDIERPATPNNRPQPNAQNPPRNNPNQPEQPAAAEKKKREKEEGPGGIERALIRPLLLLRTARLNYTERFATLVPGFTPQAELFGMGTGFSGPDWGFVAGLQPNIRNLTTPKSSQDWLYTNRNWITSSNQLNQQVVQEYNQNLNGQLSLEPVRDFRIDLDVTKVYQETYTEYFKKRDAASEFEHLVPQKFGSMNISFMAVNTLFDDSRSDIVALFNTFEENRKIISKRIGTGSHSNDTLATLGYTKGYGTTQQDVLIPAFIAAYTKQNASSIGLDIFKTMPRPNWRVSYNGLSKVGFFQDIFQSLSLTHGYKATLNVSRFNTGLDYLTETNPIKDPGTTDKDRDTINDLNGNFYARLEIPEIVIQEGFSPLLAVNAVLKNGMQFNFDYKRSRTLAMSFVSNQLSETRVKEITIGFGYLIRNLDIGFLTGSNKSRGRKKPEQQPVPPPNQQGGGRPGTGQLQNKDLDIQFNFSLRDDVTFNHLLDQDIIEPTRGNFALTFSPSAEYKINRRLSLRAFIDYRRNVPKTSAGFPRTDTQGGIVVRFQLN